jgi:hypothetical protein
MSKQIMFFAVFEDIEEILRDIERSIQITYYLTGLLDEISIPAYNSAFDIPNVGIVYAGDWNHIHNFLVTKSSTLLNVRNIPQRMGGMKYAVDQLANSESITVKFGGLYKLQENVIVAGRIGTISNNTDSNEIFKLFSTKIKKDFKKIGAFYVGKNAEQKLKSGWRLVTDSRLTKEYDLAIT